MPGRLQRNKFHAALFALAALALGLASSPARAAGISLTETGSSLLYPLFQRWLPAYTKVNPDVQIHIAATNSGTGIDAVIAGDAQIGASDAYMSDEQAEHNRQIISVPLAISAQSVNYNIPGLNATALKLDGNVLADIYSGKIRQWDETPIAELNPGVKLPHQPIVAVRRGDPSGDTFVFSQFLDFTTQKWQDNIGYGTTISWPDVPGEVTAAGNDGMVKAIVATPYSIGYVGISYSDEIAKNGLGLALLKNQSGKYVSPTAETISAAASQLDDRTPADERLSLVDAPGDKSYPLINYEYAMVSVKQRDPQVAEAIQNFLLWAIRVNGGNATQYLDAVGFIPLPDFIRAMSEKQIDRIQ